MVSRPVYTGDFCRATQCNFCRAEVASSFEHVRNLMQLRGDKNCIELRDKNRLCKRALTRRSTAYCSKQANSPELHAKNLCFSLTCHWCWCSDVLCKGPFTQAIFVAQLDAIFVAPKLHEVARPVYTGDFCRATQCNFCRAEVASSFEHVRNLTQLRRDKNCIELRDKNRLCKRALTRGKAIRCCTDS